MAGQWEGRSENNSRAGVGTGSHQTTDGPVKRYLDDGCQGNETGVDAGMGECDDDECEEHVMEGAE